MEDKQSSNKRLIVQTYYHHDSQKVDDKIGCYVPADETGREI